VLLQEKSIIECKDESSIDSYTGSSKGEDSLRFLSCALCS
jgi:hypothetical protein